MENNIYLLIHLIFLAHFQPTCVVLQSHTGGAISISGTMGIPADKKPWPMIDHLDLCL